MHQIPDKVDFYITNVCNLTCENCNRFNNHDFKGWQRWSDYEEQYQQWGRLVKLKAITLMGGEPMLNPTISDWIAGLNKIFNIEVQILTNGTRFRQVKKLYPFLLWRNPYKPKLVTNHIGVSVHNLDEWPEIESSIYDFLKPPVRMLPKGQNHWNSDWWFCDKNGVQVNAYIVNEFNPSSIIPLPNGGYTLHNSDPQTAHARCSFAIYKSYHFIKGKLYKCGPVALMPEFDQQHNLDISEEDRVLLNSYKPLDLDNFAEYHKEFFANLDNPIAQCKFCPTRGHVKFIRPVRKGSS